MAMPPAWRWHPSEALQHDCSPKEMPTLQIWHRGKCACVVLLQSSKAPFDNKSSAQLHRFESSHLASPTMETSEGAGFDLPVERWGAQGQEDHAHTRWRDNMGACEHAHWKKTAKSDIDRTRTCALREKWISKKSCCFFFEKISNQCSQ